MAIAERVSETRTGRIGATNVAAAAARHRVGPRQETGEIVWTFLRRGKWQYLPLLLSDYGREIIRRKYDAMATDRAYENRPSGLLGPVGRAVNRFVLDLPLHVALRQRLMLVADRLERETAWRASALAEAGETRPARVLSAPCGLCRDLLLAAALRRREPRLLERIEWHALDLDPTLEALPLAAHRARLAGLPVRFYREDLFGSPSLAARRRAGTPFDVVNCIGLTAWLDLADVERLARSFHAGMARGGGLIVDNWARHRHSALGRDLEIETRYHDPAAFAGCLERAGFRVVEAERTANGIATVYVARAL